MLRFGYFDDVKYYSYGLSMIYLLLQIIWNQTTEWSNVLLFNLINEINEMQEVSKPIKIQQIYCHQLLGESQRTAKLCNSTSQGN